MTLFEALEFDVGDRDALRQSDPYVNVWPSTPPDQPDVSADNRVACRT